MKGEFSMKYTVMNDYGFGNNADVMEFDSYEEATEEFYRRKAHDVDDVIIINNITREVVK